MCITQCNGGEVHCRVFSVTQCNGGEVHCRVYYTVQWW